MPHIPRAFCGCGHEMRIKKTGAIVQANTDHPYYKVAADTYECPNCLAQIHLPADRVLTQQHQDNFDNFKHDVECKLV